MGVTDNCLREVFQSPMKLISLEIEMKSWMVFGDNDPSTSLGPVNVFVFCFCWLEWLTKTHNKTE